MNKFYIKDFLVFIITITIMVLVNSSSFFPGVVDIGNYYVSYASIVAAILFIILIVFKTNERIILVQDTQRITFDRLITLFVYKFMYIGLIYTFISTNQIGFISGLVLIFMEFAISIMDLIITNKNVTFSGTKFVFSARDLIFNVLVLVLILNNMPFQLYAIPADLILISLYLTILVYITYSLVTIVRSEI